MKAPDRYSPSEWEWEAPSYSVPELTVYPPDDGFESEVLLYGPDGEPLWVSGPPPPEFPFGFCRP